MSEFGLPVVHESLSDPLVCQMALDVLDLQVKTEELDVDSLRREALELTIRYEGFLHHPVKVIGEIRFCSGEGSASGYTQEEVLFAGIDAQPLLGEEGVGSEVIYRLLCRDHANAAEYMATASADAGLVFSDVASIEHLASIYEALDTHGESLPQKIDAVIVEYCDAPERLLRELAGIDYRELPHLGIMALHAVSNHLNTMLADDIHAVMVEDITALKDDKKIGHRISDGEQNSILTEVQFLFKNAVDEEGKVSPALALEGLISSRSLGLSAHPVCVAIDSIGISRVMMASR